MNTINSIKQWHELARPQPTEKDFNVQLGCHFEEVCEMFESIKSTDPTFNQILQRAYEALTTVATLLKASKGSAYVIDRNSFLDSVCDQVVTVLGVAHCAYMHPVRGLERVDQSNWSKFVNGKPVFDENGKIAKPPTYREPDLTGLY